MPMQQPRLPQWIRTNPLRKSIFLNERKILQMCNLHLTSSAQKLSASGSFDPKQCLCPGPYWGLCPQTSIIGSRYCAYHMLPFHHSASHPFSSGSNLVPALTVCIHMFKCFIINYNETNDSKFTEVSFYKLQQRVIHILCHNFDYAIPMCF